MKTPHWAQSINPFQPQPTSVVDTVLPAVGLFGAGLVVGAGIGLLLAPKSGRDLRHDIASTAGDVAHKVRDAIPFGQREDAPSNGVTRREEAMA